MNNQQRNELCHCGSGKKYKNCCMRKDEAQAQLSKQTYDVRRVIGPKTTPYMFWKNWSAACGRNEYGLVHDMLLQGGEIAEKFSTTEDFYMNINEIGIPFEARWNLDKIKIDGSKCYMLCHRTDSEDKNADVICSMMSLQQTEVGLRVANIQRAICKPTADFALCFDIFGLHSAEGDYIKKVQSGWKRPDLTDEATRFVAPAE